MRKTLNGFVASALLIAGACAGSGPTDDVPLAWFGRTRGGAVVLSQDERVAVVANRSAGVVAVFKLDPSQPLEHRVQGRAEIDMGEGTEPWAAVIREQDDSAFVISRHAQTVTRIIDLHGRPRRHGSIQVGSEPTAIAIAPSGKRVFIANWSDGTISVVWTPDFSLKGTVDLNAALASTGVLGSVEPRPGLAHPRALALTDDGDDDDKDEALYATEFFSMPFADAPAAIGPGYFDRNRQGFVYRIPLGTSEVAEPIAIAPVDDTGFLDSNQATTGCIPNQLYAAAISGDRLFVTGMCASPAGPLNAVAGNPANFKAVVHPAVFVIDTRENRELPDYGRLLTRELDQRYELEQASNVRMPLIPNDIAFSAPALLEAKAARLGCLTALGADAVFCLRYDIKGSLVDIGSRGRRFLDLAPPDQRGGRLPIGIALSRREYFGVAVSDNSQLFSVLDLKTQRVRSVERTVITLARGLEQQNSPASAGRQHFATGLGVWSFQGQAWVSCESCHPDGLSDGLTWFFARGPRRTISTAGTYDDTGHRRALLWTANVDEVQDVEGIVRTVAGGVGAVLWHYPGDAPANGYRLIYDGTPMPPAGKSTSLLHNNLNASIGELLSPLLPGEAACDADSKVCDKSLAHEWDEIDAYIRTVRSPRQPAPKSELARGGLDAAEVQNGARLFREARCPDCHGGPAWTVSRVFYTPGAANNGALPYARPDSISPNQLGLLRTLRYDVPEELRPLNPPGASGTASYRRWDFPPDDRDAVLHLYGTGMNGEYNSAQTHTDDQLNCALRAVGTFPSDAAADHPEGVVPPASPIAVRELRANMKDLALGASGYNVPSLVGLAASAPYFHAGNARTLEELFDPAFEAHYQALAAGFLAQGAPGRAGLVDQLVAYLLSIDDDSPSESDGLDLCTPDPNVVR